MHFQKFIIWRHWIQTLPNFSKEAKKKIEYYILPACLERLSLSSIIYDSVFRPSWPLLSPTPQASGYAILFLTRWFHYLVRLLIFLRPAYPLLYKSFSDILDDWSFFPLQFHVCFYFLEVLITLHSNYLPTRLLLLLDSDLLQEWQRSCISVFLIPNAATRRSSVRFDLRKYVTEIMKCH